MLVSDEDVAMFGVDGTIVGCVLISLRMQVTVIARESNSLSAPSMESNSEKGLVGDRMEAELKERNVVVLLLLLWASVLF
jgi:hypothetical protein